MAVAGSLINGAALTFVGGGTALANVLSATAVSSAVGLGLAAYALTRPAEKQESSGYHKRQGLAVARQGGIPKGARVVAVSDKGPKRKGKSNGGKGPLREIKVSAGGTEGRPNSRRQGKNSEGRSNLERLEKDSEGKSNLGRLGKVSEGRSNSRRQGKNSEGRSNLERLEKDSEGKSSVGRQGKTPEGRLHSGREGKNAGGRPIAVSRQGKSNRPRFAPGKPGSKLGRQANHREANHRSKREQQDLELGPLAVLQYEEKLELQETLELIRQHDTAGCGKRLMCELGGMSQEQLTIEELSILNLVRPSGNDVRGSVKTNQASLEYLDAKTRGQKGEKCGNVYPLCTLNGKQLMTIVMDYLP